MRNEYGVDVDYFTKELNALIMSLKNRTPEELERYLIRLSEVAKPVKKEEIKYFISYQYEKNGLIEFTRTCITRETLISYDDIYYIEQEIRRDENYNFVTILGIHRFF